MHDGEFPLCHAHCQCGRERGIATQSFQERRSNQSTIGTLLEVNECLNGVKAALGTTSGGKRINTKGECKGVKKGSVEKKSRVDGLRDI